MIQNQSEGYSLIEIIVVIAVTGILAGISVPSLINWKHLQDIKTRQLALKTSLEKIKGEAKRWGGTCTISGITLKMSCESAVLQKSTTDIFDMQSNKELTINPTIKDRDAESVFVATNFNTITFSPRGFIHIDPIKAGESQAIFVLGYQSDSDTFKNQAPELCVIIENLTGRVSTKKRNQSKINSNNAIIAKSGLSC